MRVRMLSIVKPLGSTLPGCHSLWPMTERSLQPWWRQIAAETFSMASFWASGQGSVPLPRLMHSKP